MPCKRGAWFFETCKHKRLLHLTACSRPACQVLNVWRTDCLGLTTRLPRQSVGRLENKVWPEQFRGKHK
jgi:hypothetical protein